MYVRGGLFVTRSSITLKQLDLTKKEAKRCYSRDKIAFIYTDYLILELQPTQLF